MRIFLWVLLEKARHLQLNGSISFSFNTVPFVKINIHILIKEVSFIVILMFKISSSSGMMITTLLGLIAPTRIVLLREPIVLLVIVSLLCLLVLVYQSGSTRTRSSIIFKFQMPLLLSVKLLLEFFKLLDKKVIFLDFIPHTARNIKWYDFNTGYIGTVSCACFDEGVNDLSFDVIPPNQLDLERVEQGEAFPAKLEETDAGNNSNSMFVPLLK